MTRSWPKSCWLGRAAWRWATGPIGVPGGPSGCASRGCGCWRRRRGRPRVSCHPYLLRPEIGLPEVGVDLLVWLSLELLGRPNGERIGSIPCAATDWSDDAADHQPPAQPVGSDPAQRAARPARRAGPGRPPAGRPSLLGAVPGPLRPDHRAAVDPDRDLPADDVPQVPLPAGL